MKALILLAAVTSSLASQQRDAKPIEGMILSVRAADATQPVIMHIRLSGELFASLGVAEGQTGTLRLEGDRGTATGIITGELASGAGEIMFSSSRLGADLELAVFPASGAMRPRLFARGRDVRVVRASSGTLMVQSGWLRLRR
jgi:hypothetical protein